ncbi:hypothetical protein A2U01_0079660, partial [Trifolium medium]|nr:hypothetical protein [Trifolium medium]
HGNGGGAMRLRPALRTTVFQIGAGGGCGISVRFFLLLWCGF